MTYTAETRVLAVDPQRPASAVIDQAAQVLIQGGLVAFPTETVYGLGASALDAAAIQRIYSAKGRPAHNPLIVHIAAVEQLDQVAAAVPELAYRLARDFWPGPLTLVLPRHVSLPPVVSLGRATVAVRMPSHPVALALIRAAGVPVVAPSANRFTRPSATTAQHVQADLAGHVDLILDGGPTPIGVESTVLDVTVQPPQVLRPGGVTFEALRVHIPDLLHPDSHIAMEDAAAHPASPGMLVKHYSPTAAVLLFDGPYAAVSRAMLRAIRERLAVGQRVGVLATDDDMPLFADLPVARAALGADLEANAQHLFAALRALDAQGVDVIVARQFAAAGLGVTLADRLLRAAAGRLITVA
jgi:L-threonylcarbamoyladenylate synthase